eukprot:TRINITY_DN2157_c0_g1_i1.p1 TRINITY_DN2157_c0_g1~~TRINITY_DN2157_c0_g1_i1.p1  ORF type:complete len:785 (+),score=220.17 TRINITY_DN2157_c0_g1_i1:1226-3580(+)
MSRKIQEMSDIVGYVADRMSNDTVLFVLGDHGMKNTGDHGGDSRDEISSTFLVYNKKYKFRSTDSRMVNPSQIDFLPTASLWMGLPIPFSNLGAYLPLLQDERHNQHFIKSNVDQVMSYFQGYFTSSSRQEFSKTKVRHLEDLFREFKAQLKGVMSRTDFRSSEKLGFEILDHAKRMCQSVWAQFNLTPMGAGLSLILVHTSALLPLLLINDSDFLKVLNKDFLPLLVISGLVGAGGLPVFASLVNPDLAFNPLLILSSGASLSVIVFGVFILWTLRKECSLDINMKSFYFSLFYLGLLSLTLSNSFVVEEPYIQSFVLNSFLIGLPWFIPSTGPYLRCLSLIIALLVRCSNVYFICREEQVTNWGCETMLDFTKSIGDLPQEVSRSLKNWRFFSTLLSVFLTVALSRRWLKNCGNLNGSSPIVALVKYAPSFCGLSMVSYWALNGSRLASKILPWQRNILALSVFLLSSLTTLAVLFRPLLVYLQDHEADKREFFRNEASSIYNYLKMQYAKGGGGVGCSSQSKKESVRPVYGIGTALSAPLVAIILCVSLSSMLVLGDGICPSIAVMLAVMVMIAFLNAVDNQANSVRYSSILLWWLAQNVFFYASGHSTTFSSIHWSAAFVGFNGDDYGKENYVIPFILVIWNTYISRILFALALLLLYLSTYTLPLTASPGFLLSRAKDEGKKGELSLLEMETGRVRSGMLRLYLNYSLLLGLQLFFSMLSAGVLRRHLMVWKIFTPKFIFEGVGFLMSLVSLLAGYIVWARVHGLMNKYYAKLILGGMQ